jgi:copper(I)-binding protein
MSFIRNLAFASTLSLAALAGAAQADEVKLGNLVISDVWSRQSPMFTDAAAGFMIITNTGAEADTLVKATAEITPTVQLHEMKMENDVMKMAEVAGGIPLPAGATVELKPGGLHVMFMGLSALPKEGDVLKGTLTFEKAGTVDVQYVVKAPMQ